MLVQVLLQGEFSAPAAVVAEPVGLVAGCPHISALGLISIRLVVGLLFGCCKNNSFNEMMTDVVHCIYN
jgi:hypothetical protein